MADFHLLGFLIRCVPYGVQGEGVAEFDFEVKCVAFATADLVKVSVLLSQCLKDSREWSLDKF